MIDSPVMRFVLVVAIALAGCGPIVYVNEVTRHAQNSYDEAEAAQADKYAPYYWTRAKEYLRKSRELAAVADFQAANRFGRLAGEAAEKALEETAQAKQTPSKTTAPAKEGAVAPAKDSGE
jgi:hypothetical protein